MCLDPAHKLSDFYLLVFVIWRDCPRAATRLTEPPGDDFQNQHHATDDAGHGDDEDDSEEFWQRQWVEDVVVGAAVDVTGEPAAPQSLQRPGLKQSLHPAGDKHAFVVGIEDKTLWAV